MKQLRPNALALLGALAGCGFAMSVAAQDQETDSRAQSTVLEEIIVNAQRREENLQDVAASMSVFSQEKLDNANIFNASDLATYTPSLQAGTRFGGDSTTFAIRGFSQELRTTASVGVFFAEVVAPRGANTHQSGDGAGPGDFFDLANVQVLKGPQGTLFGRNTTGGAVLLMPQKPTDEFEGYIEGSVGNYEMGRGQVVINMPVTDSFKVRLGIDHQERDGYLNNISDIGPDEFADTQYTALRLSAVWDITDTLENYTIVRHTESINNGYPGSLFYCNIQGSLGFFCALDQSSRESAGDNDFYDVYNFLPNPVSELESSQIINTTTWNVTDSITVKNILSYAAFETQQRSAIYGTNWSLLGDHLIFQMVGVPDNGKTTDQDTLVEEIQVQGVSLDDRLTWQVGLYYEKSEPGSDYGADAPALIACNQTSITSSNPVDFRCNDLLGYGVVQRALGGVEYTNQAVYGQATYDINDQWSITAGLRYTKDETDGEVTEDLYFFPTLPPGSYSAPTSVVSETRTPSAKSEEPTWTLGVDYTPTDSMLLYGKYTRGYRQGSVNLAGTSTLLGLDTKSFFGLDLQTHDPEQVDTIEFGSKNTFEGAMPATLNVAAFYNDFRDQQIQFGYYKPSGVGTTAILNAGASTMWGVELEGSVQLTESVTLNASYAYLNTKVDELEIPTFLQIFQAQTTTAEGEPLSYAPENKLVLTAAWMLPVPVELGDMRLATTYVYTDEMQAASKESSEYSTLSAYKLVNLNFDWKSVMGSRFDASLFVTNLTDKEYITFMSGNWNTGLETGQVGQPRMYGARVRYNF